MYVEAEFYCFPDSKHHFIERPRLGMTTVKLRNGSHIKAIIITLDDNVKLSLHFSLLIDSTTKAEIGQRQ